MDQSDKHPHQTQFSVYMLGSKGCGKTSLLHRYLEDKYNQEPENIETPITKHSFIDGSPVGLNLYDDMYKEQTSDEFFKLKGLLIMFDISSKEQLSDALKMSKKIKDKHHIKFLVGTKIDQTYSRQVEKSEAIEKASFEIGENTKYYECSAKRGDAVEQIFRDLQERLLTTAKEIAQRPPESSCCILI